MTKPLCVNKLPRLPLKFLSQHSAGSIGPQQTTRKLHVLKHAQTDHGGKELTKNE